MSLDNYASQQESLAALETISFTLFFGIHSGYWVTGMLSFNLPRKLVHLPWLSLIDQKSNECLVSSFNFKTSKTTLKNTMYLKHRIQYRT